MLLRQHREVVEKAIDRARLDLDSAALVGWASAQSYLDFDGHPTTVYLRAAEQQVDAVRSVLGRTANPNAPSQVVVSRPSDALVAKRATQSAWNGLLLGLGGVALLVGGVGIANTMVMAVLERTPATFRIASIRASSGSIGDNPFASIAASSMQAP